MNIGRRLSRLFSRGDTERPDRTRFECERCGERYDRLQTPCEKCGGSVMTEIE